MSHNDSLVIRYYRQTISADLFLDRWGFGFQKNHA